MGPAGNYVSMDLQNLQMKMGFLGVGKAGSTDSAEAKSTIDLAKAGLASGFSGTATMLGSTKKNNKSDATALADRPLLLATTPPRLFASPSTPPSALLAALSALSPPLVLPLPPWPCLSELASSHVCRSLWSTASKRTDWLRGLDKYSGHALLKRKIKK